MSAGAQPAAAPADSAQLAQRLASLDNRRRAATLVGCGAMGRHYAAALRALGVGRVRICARSGRGIAQLRDAEGLELITGGVERWAGRPERGELGIVAVPVGGLVMAADRLAELGFRRLLIEKPVALEPAAIEALAERLERAGVEAACAYNRAAYPAVVELRSRAAEEGGITSCLYGFTELIGKIDPAQLSPEERARWGVANSLHVMSLAHALIGEPAQWSAYRSGGLAWHPAGSAFAGAGVSSRGIPFAYHADWGSVARWWVEAHTGRAAYRFCPLETLSRRASALGEWEPVGVTAFAPSVKAGVAEQLAAMLDEGARSIVPLVSLRQAAALTAFGESVFGYADAAASGAAAMPAASGAAR